MFLRNLVAVILAALAFAAHAAVDINKASQAELEEVSGIGPAMSARMLDARKEGPFKDWADVIARVKGVGEGNASKFSANGLTVGGTPFAAGTVPVKAAGKVDAKADAKSNANSAAKTASKP